MGNLYKVWLTLGTYGLLQSCGSIGCAGWSEGSRAAVGDGLSNAAHKIAESPDIGTALSQGAGVVALVATTALGEWLRRRNKKSDLRKDEMEKKIATLENGGS